MLISRRDQPPTRSSACSDGLPNRRCQIEPRDLDVEFCAVITNHLVFPFHGSPGGFESAEALVFECFAGFEARSLSDDARAADFFPAADTVDDEPVAADELRRRGSLVADDDGVAEEEIALIRIRLLRQKISRRTNTDPLRNSPQNISGVLIAISYPGNDRGFIFVLACNPGLLVGSHPAWWNISMSWEAFRLTSKSPGELLTTLGPHGVDHLIRQALDTPTARSILKKPHSCPCREACKRSLRPQHECLAGDQKAKPGGVLSEPRPPRRRRPYPPGIRAELDDAPANRRARFLGNRTNS